MNNYLSSRITEYLYKTSNEFKSCINDFDKIAMKNFFNNSDWNNYNWNSCFSNAVFDVNVHAKINSSLLLNKT